MNFNDYYNIAKRIPNESDIDLRKGMTISLSKEVEFEYVRQNLTSAERDAIFKVLYPEPEEQFPIQVLL